VRTDRYLRAAVRGAAGGVSLLELCVVVAVMLVVAATAIPTMMTAMQHYRLRTSGKDVAAMLQAARMRCVRDNSHYTVQQQDVTQGSVTFSQMFLDQNGNGSYEAGEMLVQLPGNVRLNAAAAPTMPASTVGYTAQPSAVALSFNGMGLPCVVRDGICTNWDASGNAVGVVYYLQDTRANSAWVAVSVSPAGRTHTWQWSAGDSQWREQ
jgi:Tfp pilus assembly protein FimT